MKLGSTSLWCILLGSKHANINQIIPPVRYIIWSRNCKAINCFWKTEYYWCHGNQHDDHNRLCMKLKLNMIQYEYDISSIGDDTYCIGTMDSPRFWIKTLKFMFRLLCLSHDIWWFSYILAFNECSMTEICVPGQGVRSWRRIVKYVFEADLVRASGNKHVTLWMNMTVIHYDHTKSLLSPTFSCI